MENNEFKPSKLDKLLYSTVIKLSFFSESKIISGFIFLITFISLFLSFFLIPQPYTVIFTVPLGFFLGVRTMILLAPKHTFRISSATDKIKKT